MKIEMWSDFACPFCYIGYTRLKKAIKKADIRDVKLVYRSFLLDPLVDNEVKGSPVENLAKKYNQTVDKAQLMLDQVSGMAREEGLNYDFVNLKERNMINSHRLVYLAREYNLEDKVVESLFKAHLVEGKDLGSLETLKEIGIDAGLDGDSIEELYEKDRYVDEIQFDLNEAYDLGINSVPYFIIDRDRSIRGAQSVDIMVHDLKGGKNL